MSLVRYRYRAYPTGDQEQALARTFGCARVVFNDALRMRQDADAAGEKVSDAEVQRRVVTLAKTTPERAWLGEVASVALVQACQDARRAYRNWFDSLAGRRKGRAVGTPRFRSRKDNRQSVRLTRNGFTIRPNGRVYVAKVGDLRVVWSRALPSVPSSCTVIREADGRYYVSFVVDRADQPLPHVDREVGVDLGLDRLAVTSNGETSTTPVTCGPRSAGSAARSGSSPGSRRGRRTGLRPSVGSPRGTGGCGRPGSTRTTSWLCGWSATTKRSIWRACPWPVWRGRNWPAACRTRAGRRWSG